MEMQKITEEGEKRNEGDEGASEPKLEVKTQVEEEPDHYTKLQSPAEDIYSEAVFGDTPGKARPDKPTEGNARLYRYGCLVLSMICLVLLLVIIILSVQRQTGSDLCPATANGPSPPFPPKCSREECLTVFPNTELQRVGCQQCAPGWLAFERSCFFLSTYRLSWDDSQKNCTARGGALAVVSSPGVQSFLTKVGQMIYWIGLRKQREDKWTWVSNAALGRSYWAEGAYPGGCGILRGGSPSQNNWITAPCEDVTYFICQLQLMTPSH